jgi:hypothetical protein
MFHNSRAVAAVALALGAVAVTAPSASAQPIHDPLSTTTQPAVEVVHVTDHRGFDWGDAGIGAAGGFAISILLVGGTLAVLGIRTRRTKIRAASSADRPARSTSRPAVNSPSLTSARSHDGGMPGPGSPPTSPPLFSPKATASPADRHDR